jgi:GNAT superfamily N-acetyltransferase
MSDIHIEPFKPEMTAEASQVLARAFVTNPLNSAAFGPAQLARNEAFFRNGLAVMKGTKLVALEGSRIVGLIHWVQSPGCQLGGLEKLKTIPTMLGSLGFRSSLRLGSWLSAWEKHDPKAAHLHLGPIGVDPAMQRHRVGRRLMEQYCQAQDKTGIAGYLETDRPENVGFYRRFGFETIEEVPVLGVKNFLMQRRHAYEISLCHQI